MNGDLRQSTRAQRKRGAKDKGAKALQTLHLESCPHPTPHAGKEQMKIMTDQLFKHNLDEAEKEFSYTEFLQLVDDKNGILGQAAKKGK